MTLAGYGATLNDRDGVTSTFYILWLAYSTQLVPVLFCTPIPTTLHVIGYLLVILFVVQERKMLLVSISCYYMYSIFKKLLGMACSKLALGH